MNQKGLVIYQALLMVYNRMKNFKFLSLVFACFAVFALASCELLEGSAAASEDISVSIKKPKVSSDPGQQFVDVKCSGEWTITLVQDNGEVDWATLSVDSGKGNKSNIRLDWKTNSTQEDRTLEIYLDNGSKSVFCSFTQVAGEYRPEDDPDEYPHDPNDPDKDPVVTPGGDSGQVTTAWMELPAMDNKNLGYYTHSFKMSGKTYRNYTFGWSQKDRVALWVAYPLCKLYTNGSAGRTEAWELDPLLGENSAAPFGGYAGDYDRGHQLPSADRQCCYEANAQTYYGTNMTPQLPGLNQKIWAKLEDKVRGYANASDTTYVVTGCMVSSSSKTEKDSYGNKVTIPDAYFKAVLKYSKSSTLGAWNAIAFYFEHRTYSETNVEKKHSMSIDKLEEITGLDFFVNLPAKLGEDKAAKIEAADPTTAEMWW